MFKVKMSQNLGFLNIVTTLFNLLKKVMFTYYLMAEDLLVIHYSIIVLEKQKSKLHIIKIYFMQ